MVRPLGTIHVYKKRTDIAEKSTRFSLFYRAHLMLCTVMGLSVQQKPKGIDSKEKLYFKPELI